MVLSFEFLIGIKWSVIVLVLRQGTVFDRGLETHMQVFMCILKTFPLGFVMSCDIIWLLRSRDLVKTFSYLFYLTLMSSYQIKFSYAVLILPSSSKFKDL
jgi:hypothetical protein